MTTTTTDAVAPPPVPTRRTEAALTVAAAYVVAVAARLCASLETTTGWASGLLNLLPNRSRDEPKDHAHYHAVLAKAIADDAARIRALAAK